MQSVLGFFLHKNNTSSLLLGLYHASVNRISIVLMQIIPQNRLHYGIVQVENRQKLFVSEQKSNQDTSQLFKMAAPGKFENKNTRF